MAAGVVPADAERERPAASDAVRPERTGRERGREGLDCDPDADTAPPSSGGDGLAAQGRPCPDVLPRDPRSDAAVPQ